MKKTSQGNVEVQYYIPDKPPTERSPLLNTKSMGGSIYWPKDKVKGQPPACQQVRGQVNTFEQALREEVPQVGTFGQVQEARAGADPLLNKFKEVLLYGSTLWIGRQTVTTENITFPQTTYTSVPGWGYRHLVVFLGFVGFCNVYALRANLSVAIVAMVNTTSFEKVDFNETIPGECPHKPGGSDARQQGEFHWSPDVQGIILSAYFYGYLATEILGAYLAERFGGKIVFGAGLFVSAVFTLVTAPAARWSPYALIAVRVIEGLGQGVTMPAMYTFLSKWSPPQERSMLVAFVLAGKNFGTVLAQPLTGILCEYGFDGGWPSVFYVFGGIGVITTIIWMLFVYDDPSRHPHISFTEKVYLMETTAIRNGENRPPTPWKSILTTQAVWALAVAHIAHNWGYHTLFTTLPQYLSDVLKFSVAANGIITALPYLVRWFSENLAGWFADYTRRKRWLRTNTARKLFNSVGFISAGVFLVVEGFVGCNQTLGVVMITLSLGLLGICAGGYQANHLDIAPLYAGTLMGITNTLATIPGMITPVLVTSITGGKPLISLWRNVFIMIAAVYAFGAVIFVLFGSGREQPWAKGDVDEQDHPKPTRDSDSGYEDRGHEERLDQSLCMSLHE